MLRAPLGLPVSLTLRKSKSQLSRRVPPNNLSSSPKLVLFRDFYASHIEMATCQIGIDAIGALATINCHDIPSHHPPASRRPEKR
jgi:hypothetical protein